MAAKKAARKRELIEPTPGDRRFVRRDKGGKFKDVVDVGRSLAADRRSKSTTAVKPGQGDKGDVKRPAAAKSSAKKSSAKKAPAKKAPAKKAPAKKAAAKKAPAKKVAVKAPAKKAPAKKAAAKKPAAKSAKKK